MAVRHSVLDQCQNLALWMMSADAAMSAFGLFWHPFGLSANHSQYLFIKQKSEVEGSDNIVLSA